jgi:hypothetical protein
MSQIIWVNDQRGLQRIDRKRSLYIGEKFQPIIELLCSSKRDTLNRNTGLARDELCDFLLGDRSQLSIRDQQVVLGLPRLVQCLVLWDFIADQTGLVCLA